MSDPRFLQKGFTKQLAHVVEECGEVLAAAGKTQRWGRRSSNPLLPRERRETNEEWLARELRAEVEFLRDAMARALTAVRRQDLRASLRAELMAKTLAAALTKTRKTIQEGM